MVPDTAPTTALPPIFDPPGWGSEEPAEPTPGSASPAPPLQTPLAPAAPARILHGRPALGIPGRAAEELRSGPVGPEGDRPDVALCERETATLEVLGVSARGVSHRFNGLPRQDAFGLGPVGDEPHALAIVVADGVGSYPRSHVAADLAVREALGALADGVAPAAAVEAANAALAAVGSEAPQQEMATTLLVAIVTEVPSGSVSPATVHLDLAWVGDPYAWALSPEGWLRLDLAHSHEDGEFASTAAHALPADEPAVLVTTVELDQAPLFLMTDGVGRPLDDIADVSATLASWWREAPDVYTFAGQVEFARRGHTDDRTVVGLWPRVDGRP